MDADAVLALVARHVASIQELMDLDIAMLTDAQKMAVLTDLETAQRRLPVLTHRILAALQREASPMELGSKSWRQVLTDHLRLSKKDARQRLDAAAALGPRVSLSGQALGPRLPKVAAAQAAGTIGAEHVTVIGEFFAKLPEHVCAADRDVCENALLAHAATTGPDQLAKLATDLIAYFDQDGPPPHDDADDDGDAGGGEAEHTPPTRTLDVGKQHPDGTVQITGRLSAQTWAYLEPILAKYAAPGMCNPADQQPCVTGTPTQTQIDEDTRTSGQRRHDALTAITRTALTSGELGQHNGLPVSRGGEHHAAGPAGRRRVRGHRRRLPHPDAGTDRDGLPRPPVAGGVRPPHQRDPLLRAEQADRPPRAPHRAVRPRPGLHQTGLHRRGVRHPGASHPGLGAQPGADQRR